MLRFMIVINDYFMQIYETSFAQYNLETRQSK